jgi:hypothetical protein
MTIAELIRLIESKKRVMKIHEQKQANFDYVLADLIGRSVARVYNSSNTLPDITEAYPNLFNSKEIENQKNTRRAELSVLRFKQFANAYNNRFKEAEVNNE